MTSMKRTMTLAASVFVLGVVWTTTANAGTPLPAREGVYQRVLARPGVQLAPKPGDASGIKVPPLKIFYVFERRDAGGAA